MPACVRFRVTPHSAPAVLAVVLVAVLAGLLAAPAAALADTPRPHDQLEPLRAEQAWQHSTGAGVTVAVLDSGVDATHPDLEGRVLPGADYVDGSTDGRVDPVGHGTAVASLIVGAGATGLAPDARILPVRVLDEENRYESSATVADGVIWAVEQGAQVINLSLGGSGQSEPLSDAIEYAMANDVVVIACTGNERENGTDEVWYPAREPGVIAVAGLAWSDGVPEHWSRSLTGPETVLSAPAVLVGARPGGGYREVQGTSFAAALVTATAALIRAHFPEASAGDVVHRLVATAANLGDPGRDARHGFGALDPVAALTADLPPVPANPLDTRARHGDAWLGSAPWKAERRDLLPDDGAVEIAAGPAPARGAGTGRGDDAAETGGSGEDALQPLASTAARLVPAGLGAVGLGEIGLAGLATLTVALLLAARTRTTRTTRDTGDTGTR